MKRYVLLAAALLTSFILSLSACQSCTVSGPEESTAEQTAETTAETTTETTTEKETEETTTEESTTEESTTEKPTAEETTEESTTEKASSEETSKETEKETEKETVHEHALQFTPGVYPACQVSGHYEYYYCPVCDKYYWEKTGTQLVSDLEQLIIPALAHDLALVPEKASGCTEAGHAAYYQCQRCGAMFWDANGSAPISNPMEASYYPLGHFMIHEPFFYPTCEEKGTIEHWRCGLCGKLFWDAAAQYPIENKAEVELAPYGHDWSDWVLHPESKNTYTRYCYNDPSHQETMVKP